MRYTKHARFAWASFSTKPARSAFDWLHRIRGYRLGLLLWAVVGTGLGEPGSLGSAFGAPARPMPVNEDESTTARWLEKPVLSSRLLDDMENLEHWSHQGFGEMHLTQDRCRDGIASIRLSSPTVGNKPSSDAGRPFGAASVRRSFPREDWSHYNRLSVWVYPNLPGFKVISLLVTLHNDGEIKVPDSYGREGLDFVLLKPNQWNHVVWEIAHLARDHVTGASLTYRLQGNEPGASNRVWFDFDRFELQRVKADPFEGWTVAPGRIAFSHTGYTSGSRKTALASGQSAPRFQVVRQDTARVVLDRPVRNLPTRNGVFQELDFTEVRQPGAYVLRLGDLVSRPFQIQEHVWRNTAWKVLNFFYCERCGAVVPGIHEVCHQDWQAVHGNHKISINGGWHDAGDLSQGVVNTAEAVYAMFSLAGHLRAVAGFPDLASPTAPASIPSPPKGNLLPSAGGTSGKMVPQDEDLELSDRLIEEAQWGLEWLLKTRFGDGNRVTWATMDYWTDGLLGTVDDTLGQVGNGPFENYLSAAAEAWGARVLRSRNPDLAVRSLTAAEMDWRFAAEKRPPRTLELASAGLLAALELNKATGQPGYATQAVALANVILNCQQREIRPWTIPLSGFFYTSPTHERLQHYSHRGHEQAPIVALTELCATLPDHPDWMRWYSAVLLYSEYVRTLAKLTEPYGMLPSGVYRIDESSEPWFQDQLAKGISLDNMHCIRLFPTWTAFRGNYGTLLSQTKALAVAAHLRQDLDLANLCQQQLQWIVGRNPFGQSTMYGEGYDYAPQYTALSGDMVGSLPVGIQTRADEDKPYWPAANCYNYKEVWVHPASRWLGLMADLDGPARLTGTVPVKARSVVECEEVQTRQTVRVKPDRHTGQFALVLPEGRYIVRQQKRQLRVTLLPGGQRAVQLADALEMTATQQTSHQGEVTIQLTLKGTGAHRLVLRAHNLVGDPMDQRFSLVAEQPLTLRWHGTMIASAETWVVVIVPDGQFGLRQELFGSARLR